MDPRDLCPRRSLPSLPAPPARGYLVLIAGGHRERGGSSPCSDS